MVNNIDWNKYFNRGMKNKSPLDLNLLFPDYFNKIVFRVALFCIVFLFVFTLYSNNWRLVYNFVECPSDVLTYCEFQNGTDFNLNNGTISLNINTVYLLPGEVLGDKPNSHYYAFGNRVFIIIVYSFLVNHILYWFKSGRIYPRLNKARWNKIRTGFKK